jgi:hypothetical protein
MLSQTLTFEQNVTEGRKLHLTVGFTPSSTKFYISRYEAGTMWLKSNEYNLKFYSWYLWIMHSFTHSTKFRINERLYKLVPSVQGTNVKPLVTQNLTLNTVISSRGVCTSYSKIQDISGHSARALQVHSVSRLTEYSIFFGVEFSLTGFSKQQTWSYIWLKGNRHQYRKLKRNQENVAETSKVLCFLICLLLISMFKHKIIKFSLVCQKLLLWYKT